MGGAAGGVIFKTAPQMLSTLQGNKPSKGKAFNPEKIVELNTYSQGPKTCGTTFSWFGVQTGPRLLPQKEVLRPKFKERHSHVKQEGSSYMGW